MIRPLAFLCIGIFATWQIAGADHGQKRFGLMQPATALRQPEPAATPDPAPVQRVVFVPAQPVIQSVAAVNVAAAVPATPAVPNQSIAQTVAALPEPTIAGGRLSTVTGRGANVRFGPGTTFAVLDSLLAGDQVLVVDETTPTAGWSKIRIEGDGVEGYVASRLLSQ